MTVTVSEPAVNAETARSIGLTGEEFERLKKILGREPSWTELGITSALWSEHCSYKSSKIYLREFPTEGPQVLQGPGENAGVVDVGHGFVAVFKMESHNHPSFIEPYQGSMTGVGGILRDIFTMGARPIACMDALRFGEIDAPRMRFLIDGVVRGIGGYGNCMGIPTVGGETGFHRCYNGNILVNAFALGVARRDRIFHARASGAGNPVLYVGSRTGRDGIHGATMASESFDKESEQKRPTVQVGDPFTEKILLEACLEAMRTGAIVAIQDMGAAGLTSSTFEMAGRGGTGLRLDLDRVPLRQPGLTPYEMMLSESQERMVLVAKKGREEEVEKVFRRWGLEVADIGEITETGRALLTWHGETAADIPIQPLTEEAPVYHRPVAEPADLAERWRAPEVPQPSDPRQALEQLLATPEFASKRWIWQQYDHTVRTNTVQGPGGDAAVVLLKGTPSGLAMTCDVNPVYCYFDPRRGGAQAVAEAVRNLACVGAEPVGLTDCLNFGNPERPEISWQFREAVRGISEACRALSVPVISGNVSFYNETEGASIYPTPAIAMVGVIPSLASLPDPWFRHEGDCIVLLGDDRSEFGGAAYLRLLYDLEQGRPPAVVLDAELRLARLLRGLVAQCLLHTAHDLSEGGFLIALAEACFGRRTMGARVDVPLAGADLFSETQGRALVAVAPSSLEQVLEAAESLGVPAREIGETGGADLVLKSGGEVLSAPISRLHEVWSTALPKALGL
ncbi:MAG TPA: phosphoribosylformylglycinamidine synthase subunit PurL [Thermoanaerobaculia bacterium]|jgi:phosphoribosylformylglycinamidine synthase|nr:phosphoribosylformylglycinamidine synthase subunit PurL [Thermoanaerobaculia bacterium]